MYKIAIVDDSHTDIGVLREYIQKYAAQNAVQLSVDEFLNGIEFLELGSSLYDLVFLDIRMPLMNGMSVAQKIREGNENIGIVFVTNMVNYAIRGYEVSATDYILKPLEYNVFAYKFANILRRLKTSAMNHITVKTKGGQTRILLSDLLYIEVWRHKLIYHTAIEDIESYGTLGSAYELLKEYGFAYCNSCYLVNCMKVVRIDGNTVELDRDIKLTISRAKKHEFLNQLALFVK